MRTIRAVDETQVKIMLPTKNVGHKNRKSYTSDRNEVLKLQAVTVDIHSLRLSPAQ